MTTDSPRPPLDRRRFLTLGLGALLAACAGTAEDAGGAAAGSSSSAPSASPSPSPSPSPSASPSATEAPTASALEPSEAPSAEPSDEVEIATPDYPTGIVPTSILIPAIDVDAPVIELQLTSAEVEVPEDFDDAGWWVQTRKPGEIGPAVIGGHVDSTSGPAVFFRLQDLSVGDEITVTDEAGDSRTFVVNTDPFRVKKDERPPEVFGFGDGRPELRLITCGGDFDPNERSYVDNVVVFADIPDFEF